MPYDEKDINYEKGSRRPKSIKSPTIDEQPSFQYHRFLIILLVVGFLHIGAFYGSYGIINNLMEAPCLGCLGLYPNVELEFSFDTLEDRPHPDFVIDALENNGPVFIKYTQNDENCPPCARMRPKVDELEEEYGDKVVFNIININEHELKRYFQGKSETKSSHTEEESFHVYDTGLIAGGRIATPTFVIVTLDKDEDGAVKPSFAVGYGEFKEEDAEKTKEAIAETLDYANNMYHHYYEMYMS